MKRKNRMLLRKAKKGRTQGTLKKREDDDHEFEPAVLKFVDDNVSFKVDRKGGFDVEPVEEEQTAGGKKRLRCTMSIRAVPAPPPVDPATLAETKRIESLRKHMETQGRKPGVQRKVRRGPAGAYDIWGANDENSNGAEEVAPPPSKVRRATKPLASQWQAVDIPTPGASYKPDPVEHQELLAQAVQFIVKKKEENKKLRKALRPLTAEGRPLKNEKYMRVDPMFDPRRDVTVIDAEEEEEARNNPPIKLPAIKKERRTKAQRNKELRKKAAAAAISRRKEQKHLRREIDRVGDIMDEIEEQEEKHESDVRARRNQRRLKSLMVPQKMGLQRAKLERPDVLLTSEIPNNLRSLRAPISLMASRFKNMQRRNLVPVMGLKVRKQLPRTKYRSTEKHYTWNKEEHQK